MPEDGAATANGAPGAGPVGAVVDLRAEVPARHRPTRGVPREPDRHLAAYRDRAARPARRHERGPRPLDLDGHEVVETEPVGGEPATSSTGPARSSAMETVTATPPPPATDGGRRSPAAGELVVRRLRVRSVLKVALALYLCLFAVVMLAGLLLWRLANEQGWVTGWTGFLVDIGFTDADVDGATLARATPIAGGILVATATLLTAATACLYNQVAGLIGGVTVTLAPRRRRRRR